MLAIPHTLLASDGLPGNGQAVDEDAARAALSHGDERASHYEAAVRVQ
jgi:hypothetical protein